MQMCFDMACSSWNREMSRTQHVFCMLHYLEYRRSASSFVNV